MKKEGARFIDFVRLEAEIKFKLMDINTTSLESILILESLLTEAYSNNQLERLKLLPLDSSIQKMILGVVTLRQIAYSICNNDVSIKDFDTEYKLGLLAQTLRISLFQDYLSEVQQEFAVLSAALLTNHLNSLLPFITSPHTTL